jgi:hypothetical protein
MAYILARMNEKDSEFRRRRSDAAKERPST